MDDTLYNVNNDFSYDKLNKDNELVNLIKILKGRKILFTNATHIHTNIVLHKLGLVSSFDLILDRNILGVLKPSPLAFIKLKNWCSISHLDTCYYFEDSISNLIMGKNYGWQTILINPNNENNQNKPIDIIIKNNGKGIKKKFIVDYSFKNIKTALKHFIARMPQN